MVTATLHDQDVAVLLSFLSDIHDSAEINLIELKNLRFTLANIVGDLKSQFPNAPATIANQFRKRVVL
ncbi:MAG: hypothetical protein WAW46_15790 [Polaromonas sp.]